VSSQALVSVIIPCYNHARFLAESVDSVKQQTYKNVEIIVVDDGSTDDTKAVSESLPGIQYIYQSNQGLSAARNTGFQTSKGDYVVFLDADDYLYPDAIRINLEHLQQNPSWAFISGWHDKVDEWKYPIEKDELSVIQHNHYIHFLQGNYIGMHAAVMYTRWVLNEFNFDTSLKACEDYDLYLRITRKYPVGCHGKNMAAYRIHGNNMSGSIPFMLKSALQVLASQKVYLQNPQEQQAWNNGRSIWTNYYTGKLRDILNRQVSKTKQIPSRTDRSALLRLNTRYSIQLETKILKLKLKNVLKKSLPDSVRKILYRRGYMRQYIPAPGRIQWADLERTSPVSNDFGYDRGGPVDRYYIEKFLNESTSAIRGRVLEIGDNAYTLRFGGSRVTQSDVLHVAQANDTVTFIGDLSDAPQIPSDAFDCIILTQTLHFIYDYKAALQTCHRILKKGGTLLLTIPGISHIDKGEWKDYWLWSFTDTSIRRVMLELFEEDLIYIHTYGNVYVATAFLYGMGLPEIRADFLDVRDPSYQVIIAVSVTK
jgi:glycosyltransferase involved in cell wall biosynthesis/SAM-dependent methyltransferase